MTLDALFWILTAAAFVFGAVIGSFLNVVIHRVPAGMSVVSPPSHCPDCQSRIRWYDNIPIFSWAVLLRGRCRHCGAAISGSYALVETLTALLAAALWIKVAGGPFESLTHYTHTPAITYLLPFGVYFLFICLLVVITFVDLEHLIVPHRFTLPGIAAGVAAPWLFDWLLGPSSLAGFWPPVTASESIIGLLVGAGTVVVIFYAYFAVRGVAGIGGGDVTLMGLVGAWLGWPALVFVFFAASFQGTLAAVGAMLFGGGLVRDSKDIFEAPPSSGGDVQSIASQVDTVGGADEASLPAPAVSDDRPASSSTVDSPIDPHSEPDADTPVSADPSTPGAAAVPFGPFIALAAVEHFFLGSVLPSAMSMQYLYHFGSWS